MEYIDITKLNNYERNPRKVDKKEFEDLKKSISEHPKFFEARPILCNKDYVVFAGNMRLRAAKALGLKKVPHIMMDITKEEQDKMMILDNRQSGKWDFEMLASDFEIGDLLDIGFSLGELGIGDSGKDKVDVDNMADSLEKYMSSDIRQLVLYFKAEDHEPLLTRLDKAMVATGTADYSELVVELLTQYENPGTK